MTSFARVDDGSGKNYQHCCTILLQSLLDPLSNIDSNCPNERNSSFSASHARKQLNSIRKAQAPFPRFGTLVET